jgi:hypothetical protein
MPAPKKTEQLNLRMPKELLEDIDKISVILKVNKSEWIKVKLSEVIMAEKSKLLELNRKGLMEKKDIKELLK